jgi:cytosine/adenosine deaminase-related metal-dependent hydrolase
MQIFAASCLLSISASPLAGGALAVADGRIVDTGTLAELRAAHNAPVRDFPGCVIMPGLVNAHTHLELTHFPSWKIRKDIDYAPRTYVDWVIQVIKIKRSLTSQELELSLREGFRISLESGTTALGEILSDRSLLPLYAGTPFAGRIFFEALGQDPVQCPLQLERIGEALDAFPCGNLLPGLSPHAPHTLSTAFLQGIKALADKRSLPVAIHVAESREEAAFLHDTSGKIAELLYPFVHWENYLPPPQRTTPVAYLDRLGALDERTAAVHCVQINGADAEILKRRGASVVICPRSNEKLDVGKAPVHLLKKTGIPLALGTDSLASNDSLSMWDEMRFVRQAFPGVFTPGEILEMATLQGARAIRVEMEAGSLEKGKRADFLVVDPGQFPSLAELPEALLEEGQLKEVFIGGKPAKYTPQ